MGLLRLRSASDFERVRREGKSHAHPLLVLIACLQAPSGPARVGFAAGRSVGGAVRRNRAKRLMREAVRARAAGIPPGWDLLFIARAPAASVKLTDMQAALDQLLRRARLAPPANHG